MSPIAIVFFAFWFGFIFYLIRQMEKKDRRKMAKQGIFLQTPPPNRTKGRPSLYQEEPRDLS